MSAPPASHPVERIPSGPTTVQARDGDDGYRTRGTAGLHSQGYLIDIIVTDNVLMNNNHGHRAGENEGFCLLDPGEEVVSDSDSSDGGSGFDSEAD